MERLGAAMQASQLTRARFQGKQMQLGQVTPIRSMQSIVLAIAALAACAVATLPAGVFMLQSAANPALHLRHCNFQAFAVSGYPGFTPQDFNWTIIPGLHLCTGLQSHKMHCLSLQH